MSGRAASDTSTTTLPETTVTATRLPNETPSTPLAPGLSHWMRAWDLVLEKQQPLQPANRAITTSIDIGSDSDSKTQGGTEISFQDFHITFEVTQSQTQMPWTMIATVYNVPLDWVAKLTEYSVVTLLAGYQNPQQSPKTVTQSQAEGTSPVPRASKRNPPGGSNLFEGTVIWIERGRESATDTYVRIFAANYDIEQNLAVINKNLPEGYTQEDVIKACIDAMNDANKENNSPNAPVTLGQVTDKLSKAQATRGRTLYGQPSQILRDLAQTADAYCHIDYGGQLHIIAQDDSLPNPVIVLNSQSGMVGIPHQNTDGSIAAVSLLNTSIKPGVLVQINEKDITRKMLSNAATQGEGGKFAETQSVILQQTAFDPSLMDGSAAFTSDGYFTVWSVTHHGDTRGNPWYSEIVTMPIDQSKMKPQVS